MTFPQNLLYCYFGDKNISLQNNAHNNTTQPQIHSIPRQRVLDAFQAHDTANSDVTPRVLL